MKYCTKCGSSNEDTSAFCTSCGERLKPKTMDALMTADGKTETVNEQDSLIVEGNASVGWFFLGIIAGIVGIVTGCMLKNRKWPGLGKKLMIGGIIGAVIAVVLIFTYFIVIMTVAAELATAV